MTRAQKIQKRATSIGFDWSSTEGVLSKMTEELCELEEARYQQTQTLFLKNLVTCSLQWWVSQGILM